MFEMIIYSEVPNQMMIIDEPTQIKNPTIRSRWSNQLTFKEKRTKVLLIGVLISVMGLFFYITFSDRTPRQRQHKAWTDLEKVTHTKSHLITTEQIEATVLHEAKTSPKVVNKSKKNEIKIGDHVSYEQTEEEIVAKNMERDFSSPMVIKTFNEGFGTLSRAPKLPIPPNAYTRVYLDEPVSSGNVSIPVGAISYMDLVNHGEILIPKGSRFVGKGSINESQARINVHFHTVILPNGKEYSIRAQAMGEDNVAGLSGGVDHHMKGKGGGALASSLLAAASQSARISGGGFGSLFAGEMAGNSADMIDDTIDYQMRRMKRQVNVSQGVRFKIIFQ